MKHVIESKITINNQQHTIRVNINSINGNIVIYLDGVEKVNDKPKMYRPLFYSFFHEGTKITVEFFRQDFSRIKDIYINDISITTGEHVNKRKIELEELLEAGFWAYTKKRFMPTMAKIYPLVLIAIITNNLAGDNKITFSNLLEALIFIGIFLVLFPILAGMLYVYIEWLTTKRMLKKWDKMHKVIQ